jgi:hypothetical protein
MVKTKSFIGDEPLCGGSWRMMADDGGKRRGRNPGD